MVTALDERLDRLAAQVDEWIRPYVEGRTGPTAPFYQMMAYHLGWTSSTGDPLGAAAATGKRLRPALAVLVCEALGGSPDAARGAAVAVELVHNFSLVHDDIQDRSDYRRGRETVWRLWGAPQAINVGDAMFALAQLALVGQTPNPARLPEALRRLNQTCLSLVEGQFLDLQLESIASVSFDLYEQMIARKTAALIACACSLGALAADADESTVTACADLGRQLGIAFQFQDDLLGIWGNPRQTGKPIATDILSRKKGLPLVLAMTRATGSPRERLGAILSAEQPPDRVSLAAVLEILEQLGVREQAEALVAERFDAVDGAIRGVLGAARGEQLLAFCSRLRRRVA